MLVILFPSSTTSYLDMIGALVPTLANLLTNETHVIRPVHPGLAGDVLGEHGVRLPRPHPGVNVQAQVSAKVQLTFSVVIFLKRLVKLCNDNINLKVNFEKSTHLASVYVIKV